MVILVLEGPQQHMWFENKPRVLGRLWKSPALTIVDFFPSPFPLLLFLFPSPPHSFPPHIPFTNTLPTNRPVPNESAAQDVLVSSKPCRPLSSHACLPGLHPKPANTLSVKSAPPPRLAAERQDFLKGFGWTCQALLAQAPLSSTSL